MKRVGLFLVLAFVVGCEAQFQEFSPDGKFKVQIPGTPEEMSQTLMGVKVTQWIVKSRDGGMAVVSSNSLPGVTLESSAQGQFQGMQGSISTQKQITLAGKYPGLQTEGTALSEKGFAITRIYHVGPRLYQLNVIGEKSYVNSANATKFLDSLQILQE